MRPIHDVHPAAVTSALALTLAILAIPAGAADMEAHLRYGQDGGKYDGAGVGLRLGPVWSKDLLGWRTTLHPEFELTHFRYTGSAGGPSSMNQAGAIGMFRFDRGSGNFRPYGEIGLGANLFSRDRLGEKDFSTSFQFSEHLGLGLEFGGGWFAGWRYSHYSNADIKKPNNGIDLQQILIGVHF